MTSRPGPHSLLLNTALQLGLLLFAVYYTFIGGQTAQGIYDHLWRWRTLALTTALLGLWLARRLGSRGQIPRTPLDGALLWLAGSWLLAALFSQAPVYSRETLVFWLTYLGFFYLAVDLGRTAAFREAAINALLGVSGLMLLFALLQLGWWAQAQAQIPALLRDSAPGGLPRLTVLGNPNTMAAFLTLMVPLGLYKLTMAPHPIIRLLLIGWLILLVGAIWLTGSEGGWLGLAAAGGFWSLIWLARRGWLKLTRPRLLSAAALAVGLMALVVWVAITFEGHTESITTRQMVMRGALQIWQKYPLWGAGPGAFAQELVEAQRPALAVWPDAHNIFLTLLAETGLPGAIGLIWLAAVNLKLLGGLLRRAPDEWPLAGLACAAALIGFTTHNMVDSMLKFPAIMLPVAVLAGLWIGPFALAGRSWNRAMAAAALAGLAGLALIGFRDIRHIETYNGAVAAANNGDWAAAVAPLEITAQQAGMPFYQRQLGLAAGYLAQTDPAYRPQAMAAYQNALARLEMMPNDQANLGCLLWAEGQPEAAIARLESARQREPNNFAYGFTLARYRELTAGPEVALLDYVNLLTHHPDYLAHPYWQTRPAAVTAALENLADSPAVRLDYHLSRGDFAAARQLLETAAVDPFTAQLMAGKIRLAEGQLDEAAAALEAARQLDPRQADPYLYLSQIALARPQLVEARALAEAALYLRRDAETLYQAGLVAQAEGQAESALQFYEEAFAGLTATAAPERSRYETEAARRRPLSEQLLPCLARLYPPRLADIALAEGRLRETQGDVAGTVAVYRRLLEYMPEEPAIQTALAALCESHRQECQP